jgi:hypothetical protein
MAGKTIDKARAVRKAARTAQEMGALPKLVATRPFLLSHKPALVAILAPGTTLMVTL